MYVFATTEASAETEFGDEPLGVKFSNVGVAVTWVGNPVTVTVAGPVTLRPMVTPTFSVAADVPVTLSGLEVGFIVSVPGTC